MPKKFLKFLDLVYDQLYCIEDNIVVFYLPVLKKEGFSEDDLRLILTGLINKKIVVRCNTRSALNILPIPTRHEKKRKLLDGPGWLIGDGITTTQYVIELASRELFFDLYKSPREKTNFSMDTGNDSPGIGVNIQRNRDLSTLHPKIFEKCNSLYSKSEYPEGVEKGFKVVRDRLRELTGYEKGSEAFGKGKLHIKGAAAKNVDGDFNEGVKFLTMAIDMFRNEKSHTANAKIDDSVRAYEYLRLSSLAMNLLDQAERTDENIET